MPVKYDKVLGKLREDTSGFSGSLLDSTNTAIAEVVRGLIQSVYYTGSFDLLLAQDGASFLLMQNGTDKLGKQGV